MSFKKWMLCVCAASLVAVLAGQAPAQTPARASSPASASPSVPSVAAPPDAVPTGEADEGLVETPLPANAVDLGTIVVGGRQPGPGLWVVRKGDHVMWILGTQSPLPKRMEWDSANVQKKVAQSQRVLLEPGVSIKSDVGLFRGLAMIPTLLKARKNPDGKTLRDLVPPEQYARWQALKKRYIGGDDDVEEWRPIFAALRLYEKAIERSGMTLDPLASDAVRKAAKKHDIPVASPNVDIKIEDPKTALKAFSKQSIDDLDCFSRTLDRIEGDLGTMVGRANAWAQGDLETLRALPSRNQFFVCGQAITGSELARKLGMNDIRQRIEAKWMADAEASLADNTSTFAVMPVSELLRDDGYLAKLAAKGYMIEEP